MCQQLIQGTPADAAEVFAIIEAVKALGIASWDEEYPSLAIVQEDAMRGELYLLRQENGSLSGCITLTADEECLQELAVPGAGWSPAARPVEACRLCVAPSLQGRGIGGATMRLALEHAKGAGFDALRLLAAENNLSANRLYQRLGFRRGGRVFLYDEYFWCYEMAL